MELSNWILWTNAYRNYELACKASSKKKKKPVSSGNLEEEEKENAPPLQQKTSKPKPTSQSKKRKVKSSEKEPSQAKKKQKVAPSTVANTTPLSLQLLATPTREIIPRSQQAISTTSSPMSAKNAALLARIEFGIPRQEVLYEATNKAYLPNADFSSAIRAGDVAAASMTRQLNTTGYGQSRFR
jgi:hypothetical protein